MADEDTDTKVDNDAPDKGAAPKAEPFSKEQQDFINSLLAKEKRETKKQLEAERNRAAELEKRLKSFEETSLNNDVNVAKTSTDEKTVDGKIDILTKKFSRQLEEVQKELEAAKAARDAESRKLSEAMRDRLLDEALVAAGCNDMKAGRRYFLPDLTKQDEDGADLDTWLLKTDSGKLVDISIGISEHLPKGMRGAATNSGGSGVTSGGVKASDKNKLQQLRGEVERLRAVATNNPNPSTLSAFSIKDKELKALEASLSKGRSP